MNFVIVNDIRQPLPEPGGGKSTRWIHHATIRRNLKEYVILRDSLTDRIYLEEVEGHKATFTLCRIKDDNEWQELYSFALAAGLLNAAGTEIKASL